MIFRFMVSRYISFFLCSLTIVMLIPTHTLAAKLYKWVDKDGVVRYSDRLTVDQSKQRHQTLSPDGRVVETKERSLTEAERIELKRQQEQQKREEEEQARIKAEKDHHDQVLMMTFTSETEIQEALKERLDVIDSVINLLNKSIKTEKDKLQELEQRAQTQFTNANKTVPGGLAQNIEYFSEKILNKQKQLQLKLEEKSRIKTQYANDLVRFRELSGKSAPPAK
jgi:hypothetical protein